MNKNSTAFGAPGMEPRWTSSAKDGIGTTVPRTDGSFSRAQVEVFQAEDRTAAKSVILLMLGVFSLGLTGASIISWVVAH
jgi:hypothetical protein